MIEMAEKTFSFAEFEVDAAKRLLLKDGQPVALNPKTFDLLLTLIENRGEVVHKNDLLDKVWENQFVEENNLTVHISALRKVLGERKNEHRFLVTVPGKGYKFVAELNEESSGEIIIENHKFERIIIEEEIEAEQEEAKLLPPKRSNHIFTVVLVGLLSVAGIGVWFFFNRSMANAAPIESIAVMPFVNESGNADAEYLSDGMTESLINSLSQLPRLTVKARSSVFHYKGKEIEPRKIGSELTVQAVLLGRIVERGGNLTLSLELVDAKTNNHLWGEQYTRKMSELPVLQTEIARDVSQKLRQRLSGETSTKPQTENAEAFQLYLKGRYFWNKRTPEAVKKSLESFRQAIESEPTFAPAYAGMADSYTLLGLYGTESPLEAMPKGRAAAQKALEIDAQLAEAHASLALISFLFDYDWANAERSFQRALELKPNYATANHWYGLFLSMNQRPDEALARLQKAQELDPLSLSIGTDIAFAHYFAREHAEAVRLLNKTLEIDPNFANAHLNLGMNYLQQKKFAEAIGEFETVKSLTAGEQGEYELAWTLAFSGQKEKARAVLASLQAKPNLSEYNLSIIYAALGENQNALEHLRRSSESRDPFFVALKVDPVFDSLRSEPRFQELVKSINLGPKL